MLSKKRDKDDSRKGQYWEADLAAVKVLGKRSASSQVISLFGDNESNYEDYSQSPAY